MVAPAAAWDHGAMTTTPGPDTSGPGTIGAGGGTDVLDRELEQLLNEEGVEPGDHERFSHYVKKDKILESAITGKPVRALCGKKWTPGRDPEKFPICPTCKDIYEKLRTE